MRVRRWSLEKHVSQIFIALIQIQKPGKTEAYLGGYDSTEGIKRGLDVINFKQLDNEWLEISQLRRYFHFNKRFYRRSKCAEFITPTRLLVGSNSKT